MKLKIQQRIIICMLIEQMKKMPEYCEQIGIKDDSSFFPRHNLDK